MGFKLLNYIIMGKTTQIQWTDATFNPWHGCSKISQGCRFCYMFRDKERYGQNPTMVLKSKTGFETPLKWKDGKLIFTCSWSDWFIEDADLWRNDAWDIIRQCPQHTFQILTKRPERIMNNLPSYFGEIADRVWIGVSVESQAYVNRLSYLLNLPCKTFASFEPLLGPIKWDANMSALDWCIIGGESGNETGKYLYRPMELSWAESLAVDSVKNNVPCFVKQMGTHLSKQLGMTDRHGSKVEEFPSKLQIRQFPPNKHGK
jgi:protein gp37